MNPIALIIGVGLGTAYFLFKDKAEVLIVAEVESRQDNWNRWDAEFKAQGQRYGVDWKWLKAIAMNESSLGAHPRVARGLAAPWDIEGSKSEDGKSWGLMQFTIPTAQDFDPDASVAKLNDPAYSIKLAAQYVAWLQRQFPTVDIRWQEWVIKSYNQGVGNTRKEREGKIAGFAGEYWARFQRNLAVIESKQP